MGKYIIILVCLMAACSKVQMGSGITYKDESTTSTSVKVTTLSKRSGGSGTIIASTSDYSLILTNAHVCRAVARGGVVTADDGTETAIVSYKLSPVHDLCQITVYKQLGTVAKIGDASPGNYDSASIIGHPSLNPTTVTIGHFGVNSIIPVMMGFRECTPEDKENPTTSLPCEIIGRLPLIRKYEASYVTATIMPGSSGSGVFDGDGKLVAVVFAGNGELSYAYTVPYEYMKQFLVDVATLPSIDIDMTAPFSELISDSKIRKEYTKACVENQNLIENPVCKMIMGSVNTERH